MRDILAVVYRASLPIFFAVGDLLLLVHSHSVLVGWLGVDLGGTRHGWNYTRDNGVFLLLAVKYVDGS